jgi:hypothetical protein
LAVKYVESKYAASYKSSNAGLYVGANNYTWGRGVYVTGVSQPLSTAIYGRAGVVARFDPVGWKAFDARDPANEALYLRWLRAQPVFPEAVLTVHAEYWLNELRNHFREQFQIDVVLFRPDEKDRYFWYTQATDTWLAVSEWASASRLATGVSSRFQHARLTVLVEEEFAVDTPALTRSPRFAISSASPTSPTLTTLVRHAYATGDLVRVQS